MTDKVELEFNLPGDANEAEQKVVLAFGHLVMDNLLTPGEIHTVGCCIFVTAIRVMLADHKAPQSVKTDMVLQLDVWSRQIAESMALEKDG